MTSMMDRRAFLCALAGGLLAAPLAAGAQTAGKVPVVGILNSAFTGQSTAIAAFRSGLLDAGLIEGQTIALEIRSAGGKPEALAALAAELVQRKVDVIIALGPAALKAARDASGTIPIVAFDLETDPVAGGFDPRGSTVSGRHLATQSPGPPAAGATAGSSGRGPWQS